MRIPSQIGYVLSGSAALAILAGCSGGSTGTTSSTLPQTTGRNGAATQAVSRHTLPSASGLPASFAQLVHMGSPRGFITPALKAPGGAMGFISDYNNSVVYVLNTAGQVTATLTGFASPDGMATDKSGNLYVTNQGTNSVLVLAPPYTSVTKTLSDPGEIPIGVAVDPSGNVAVTNIFTTSSGAGNVVFYAAGSTTPTGMASSPTFTSPRFCAFDKRGDLALDDDDIYNTGAVNVGAVLHGNVNNMSGKIITLTTSNTIAFPGGVQVSTSGKLAVGDQSSSPPSVYTYNPPTGTNLGSPVSTTPLTGTVDPVNFAFAPGSTLLLEADAGANNAGLYSYPAGGSPVKTITIAGSSLPIGAAIVPTEQFTLR